MNPALDPGAVLHEVQPIRALWQWLLVALIAAVFLALGLGAFLRSAAHAETATGPWTGRARLLAGLLLLLLGLALLLLPWDKWVRGLGLLLAVLGLCLPLLAWRFRLETTVRADGVHVQLTPFAPRFIPFDEIESAEVRQYHPLREYGGWGLRRGPAGAAYTMRGDRGVQLTLKNGERILIGSEAPEALADAIRAGRPKP